MTQKCLKVSRIGQNLQELSQLELQYPEAVSSLCLHGNCLKDLQGLEAFCSLERLNLSSNCLDGRNLQQDIASLTKLTALDLASNRISCLGKLPSLATLQVLNLGHNFLTSLKSFSSTVGQNGNQSFSQRADAGHSGRQHQQTLHELDVQDNLLPSLHELQHLQEAAEQRVESCSLTRLNEANLHGQHALAEGFIPPHRRAQQQADRMLADSSTSSMPGTAHEQHLGPFCSVPPQQILQEHTIPASGGEVQTSRHPQYNSAMLNAAWQHMHPSGHPATYAVSGAAVPFSMDMELKRQNPDGHLTATQPIQEPSASATVPAQPSVDTLSPMQDQSPAACSAASGQNSRTDSQHHHALLSMFNAHLQHLLEQQKQSMDESASVRQGGCPKRQRGDQPSPAMAAQQASQTQSQDLDQGGQDSTADDAAHAPDAHGTAASARAQKPRRDAKVDAACQAGEGGSAIDHLRHDADRLRRELRALAEELKRRMQASKEMQQHADASVAQANASAAHQVKDIKQQAQRALREAARELRAAEASTAQARLQAAETGRRETQLAEHAAKMEEEARAAWEEVIAREHAHREALHLAEADSQAALSEMRQQQAAQMQAARHDVSSTQGMLQAAQQAHQALQHALANCSNELAKTQAALQRLQADGQASQTTSRAQADQLQEQLQSAEASRSEALAQVKQLTATLATKGQEHQRQMQDMNAISGRAEEEAKAQLSHAAKQAEAKLEQAEAARKAMLQRVAAAEAEQQAAAKDSAQKAVRLQQELKRVVTEAAEAQKGLLLLSSRNKERERVVMELTDVVGQQKAALNNLRSERDSLKAQVASHDPTELRRLRMSVASLSERAGELSAMKEAAGREHREREALQHQTASLQAELIQQQQAACLRGDAASAAAQEAAAAAHERVSAAESQRDEARRVLHDITRQLSDARDAIKVKEAMVDSANASIVALKRDLAEAQNQAAEAEGQLADRDQEEADRLRKLRADLDARESDAKEAREAAAVAEVKLQEVGCQAKATAASLKEKDQMLKWVEEEVDRVKGMFEEKEKRLTADAQAAQRDAEAAKVSQKSSAAAQHEAENQLRTIAEQLQKEREGVKSVKAQLVGSQAEAARACGRVVQVEHEMRKLLSAMERQKSASAAKMKQLAIVLSELQIPLLPAPQSVD
ncbi:hypothetical protein WJX74_005864 [Apatococcus lobatus]|uniref:Uncharacterized protein n=1 Tax=Apatococcus lobatus TaxID=904363 RepID=A0AAW1RPW0_9CHLO